MSKYNSLFSTRFAYLDRLESTLIGALILGKIVAVSPWRKRRSSGKFQT